MFIDNSTKEKLSKMTRQELDQLDFGAVKIDATGKVIMYNKYESDLAGVAPAVAEGKNFFTEVAPCTNNRLFLGKFKQGVTAKNLDSAFNYTFTYKMKPTNVVIHLLHIPADNSNWILVKKKAA
jgi:photoactive yellow protein